MARRLPDFVEVATWLAEAYPRCKLLPEDALLAIREIETTKAEGRKIVAGGLVAVNHELAGAPFTWQRSA